MGVGSARMSYRCCRMGFRCGRMGFRSARIRFRCGKMGFGSARMGYRYGRITGRGLNNSRLGRRIKIHRYKMGRESGTLF